MGKEEKGRENNELGELKRRENKGKERKRREEIKDNKMKKINKK